ncbi:hypothetical protein [Acinetobacter rathckeae]|uniref:hypothetical protein n=1 Tax=Acinetobacter rathckeae TaxID=2605272 RepID=UPI003898DA80
MDNSQQGQLQSTGQLEVSSQQLNNNSGHIIANDHITLTGRDQIHNQKGEIGSVKGEIRLVGGEIDNRQGLIQGESLQIEGQQLQNTAGKLLSKQSMKIEQTGHFDNSAGTLQAGQRLDLIAQGIINQQGLIQAGEQLQIDAKGGDIDNQATQDKQGIISGGALVIEQANQLNNNQGRIIGQETAKITAKQLDNLQGQVASKDLTLKIDTVNNSGLIQGENQLKLIGQQLENQGQLTGGQIDLSIKDTRNQATGQIIAKERLNMTSYGLINNGGLIQATHQLNIDTQGQDLINDGSNTSNQGILSYGDITLNHVRNLMNTSGYIGSGANITIDSNQLNNTKGTILAGERLTLGVNNGRVTNIDGLLSGQKSISITAKDIDNSRSSLSSTHGQITSQGDVGLAVDYLTNNGNTKGIVGQNIEIYAKQIDNNNGSMVAVNNTTLNLFASHGWFGRSQRLSNTRLNLSGTLDNTQGMLISGQNFSLNAADTVFTNTGKILAGQQINLDLKGLTTSGEFKTNGDMSVHVKDNYEHTENDHFLVDGALSITSDQNIRNLATLTAGQKINLTANRVINETTGTVSAKDTQIKAQEYIDNYGLMNGGETYLKSQVINNNGARIYGDHVAIDAVTLNNSNTPQQGGVIASRGNMDLGVQYLNNFAQQDNIHEKAADNAWIFSQGDLFVGGSLNSQHQATGQSKSIYNGSARIESIGNMSLAADKIDNKNLNLVVQLEEVERKHVTEYEKNGERWDSSVVQLRNIDRAPNGELWVLKPDEERIRPYYHTVYEYIGSGRNREVIGSHEELITPEQYKKITEDYGIYNYDRVVKKEIVKQSSPAQIIAGGSLNVHTNAFNNINSEVIVGGDLFIENSVLNNQTTELKNITNVSNGNYVYHEVKYETQGINQYKRDKYKNHAAYTPADEVTTQNATFGKIVKNTLVSSNTPTTDAVSGSHPNEAIETTGSEKSNEKALQQVGSQPSSGLQPATTAPLEQKSSSTPQASTINAITSSTDINKKQDIATGSQKTVDTTVQEDSGQHISLNQPSISTPLQKTVDGEQEIQATSNVQQVDAPRANTATVNTQNAGLDEVKQAKAEGRLITPIDAQKNVNQQSQLNVFSGEDTPLGVRMIINQETGEIEVLEVINQQHSTALAPSDTSDKVDYALTTRHDLDVKRTHEVTVDKKDIGPITKGRSNLVENNTNLLPSQQVSNTQDVATVGVKNKQIVLTEGAVTESSPQIKAINKDNDNIDTKPKDQQMYQLHVVETVEELNVAPVKSSDTSESKADYALTTRHDLDVNRTYEITADKKDIRQIERESHVNTQATLQTSDQQPQAVNTKLLPNTQDQVVRETDLVRSKQEIPQVVEYQSSVSTNTPLESNEIEHTSNRTVVKAPENNSVVLLGETLTPQQVAAIEAQQKAAPSPSVSTPNPVQADEVRHLDLGTVQIPHSALYKVATATQASYLVETDPAFTNYRTWLSSDYMLSADSTQGAINIHAQDNIHLSNGLNSNSIDERHLSQSSGLLGKRSEDVQFKYDLKQSIANTLNAGQNISMTSQMGDLQATHLIANAGSNISLNADHGNLQLLSAVNSESSDFKSEKKNAIKYENNRVGYVHEDIAQTQLNAGKNIQINAGQDLYIANVKTNTANGQLNPSTTPLPQNIQISTLATQNEQWNEHQSGYRGIAKELIKVTAMGMEGLPLFKAPMSIGESSKTYSQNITQNAGQLNATHIGIQGLGNTTLTSTDIHAKDVLITGEKVTLDAAEEQSKNMSSQGEETIKGLGLKLNKDSIRVAGSKSEDITQSTTTTSTSHKAGQISAGNLKIQSNTGIDIYGQEIKVTGLTEIDQGQGALNIGGYENKTTTEQKTHVETISTEIGVRNAYLDAALAVIAVKDAAKALKDAKQAYSQAEQDYATGKITKDALNDSKANIAMATTNLATAQIAAGAAVAGAVASTATYGFTIGASGQRQESTDIQSTIQGQWQGSQLDLNNLIGGVTVKQKQKKCVTVGGLLRTKLNLDRGRPICLSMFS